MKQILTLAQIVKVQHNYRVPASLLQEFNFQETFGIQQLSVGSRIFDEHINDSINLSQSILENLNGIHIVHQNLAFNQTLSKQIIKSRLLSQNLTFSQSETNIHNNVHTVNQNLTFNETLTRHLVQPESINQSLIFNENLIASHSIHNINQNLTFNETLTRHLVRPRTANQNLTFNEILVNGSEDSSSISDSLTFNETLIRHLVQAESINQSLTFNETLTRHLVRLRTANQNLTFNETLTRHLVRPRTTNQSLTFTQDVTNNSGIQPGGANVLIDGVTSQTPDMLGWNISLIKGTSGFWSEICRDISGDSLSPYDAAFQTNLGTGHTSEWFTAHQYGMPFNIISDTTPLESITSSVPKSPTTLSGVPFTPSQNVENWPVSFTVNLTSGSAVVIGTGFQVTGNPGIQAWPIVVGGTYLVNYLPPYVTVLSVQSDIHLTLTANYGSTLNGATLSGPFNLACQLNTGSGDHHQIVVTISSTTGLPSKVYEMYGTMSTDGGNTWGESVGSPSVGLWNLETGDQLPAFGGASSAAGLPYFPLCANYDEILQGAILHAMPITLGGGGSFGLGAGGAIFPAPAANESDTGRYKLGFVPLGGRLRIKSSFDISGFSAINQIILTAAKKYGFINVDWTSPSSALQIIALNDSRWLDSDWAQLWTVPTTEFELIDTVRPRFSISGPTSVTHGTLNHWSLTQDSFSSSLDSNYSANVYIDVSTDGGSSWTNITSFSTSQSSPGPFTINYTIGATGSYLFRVGYGGNPWIFPDNFAFTAI